MTKKNNAGTFDKGKVAAAATAAKNAIEQGADRNDSVERAVDAITNDSSND